MRLFKGVFIFLSIIFSISKAYSQVPTNLSFQAVIRNASNQLVVSAPVGIRVSLLQGGANGVAVYTEIHNASTNTNGLVTLEIGAGSPINGDFTTVDWSKGSYFIKVETDPAGGTNYSIVTSSQILSVPYALYAKKSADVDSLQAKVKKLDSLVMANVNPGRTTIYITGDITEEILKEKLLREYGKMTETITVFRCSRLKILDLSMVTGWAEISIRDNPVLEEVNLSNLDSTDNFSIDFSPSIRTINLEKLKSINKGRLSPNSTNGQGSLFNINRTSLTSLNFSSLTKIEDNFDIQFNTKLKELNLSNLKNSSNAIFEITRCDSLKTIQLNNMTECKDIIISFCPSLDSLNFQSLRSLSRLAIGNNINLSSVKFDNLSTIKSTFSFSIANNNLPAEGVNYILARLVAIPYIPSNPYPFFFSINLRQNIPTPPTGQGLLDKQILINRGHNVLTD
jgi:hypothetical protein